MQKGKTEVKAEGGRKRMEINRVKLNIGRRVIEITLQDGEFKPKKVIKGLEGKINHIVRALNETLNIKY